MNSRDELLGFLRQEKEAADKDKVDWAKTKEEWAKELASILENMEKWLKPAIDQNLIRLEKGEHAIWEEDLGSYTVPLIVLKTPSGKEVRVRAIGRIIIGARGRIDLVSGGKKASLIKNMKNEWVFSNPLERNVPDLLLCEESFHDILKQLIE
jgi:hypothetical protein